MPGREALAVYPNPATGFSLNASFTLAAGQAVLIPLTNAVGQEVLRQPAQLQAGANTFQVPLPGIGSGLYLLTVRGANLPAITRRVLVQQ
ncbi:T9SS type A sorting domain-containing protein [uncultured Hymenobacter sp.]|uniref:T9SS type A sorting domain-containing protein n=1 Tax=uncultured Hymenobacter sp. TaxID=170016 RepID=UPI0035C9C24F